MFHILPQTFTANQPSQYRCTQLQYRFVVISEAPIKLGWPEMYNLKAFISKNHSTEYPKIYRKSVPKQLQYRFAVNFGHSVLALCTPFTDCTLKYALH